MPSPRSLSRRAVLGAAVLGPLGATGCSPGSLDPSPADDPTFTPTSTPTGTTAPVPTTADPDSALVEAVLVDLSTAHRTVRENARLHRSLRAELQPLEELHRLHARELGGLRRTTGVVAGRSDSRRRALARVAAAEDSLGRALQRAAVQADSGSLALLLASMAASVAQHRSA